MNAQFNPAKQLLNKEAYFEQDWFDQEKRDLFSKSWVYATTEDKLANPGDYVTLQFMEHPLMVVRDKAGELKAFHNICRHRGCEVLEGEGNTGGVMVCPYHRWTYQLDGNLRGITNEAECFGDIDRSALSLHPASVDCYRGIVFVSPSPSPSMSFTDFIANMDDHQWPHSFDNGSMEYVGSLSYEMHCNWKVFYENAIDGYHLGYLHDQTLGKVYPDKNVWYPVGRNQVWYSTEREGDPQAKTLLSDTNAQDVPCLPGLTTEAFYPGVVMLFPLTILSPSPWGFYISVLEPVTPDLTMMHTHSWGAPGTAGRIPDLDNPEPIRLKDMTIHPLETGNFQIEDMWIVEKIQRTVRSPNYQVGPLAQGAGAEAPLTHFQESVKEYVGD